MFEAIATGFKPIVFENYTHQKYAIKYFKNKKQIIDAENLNQKNLNKLIYHLDKYKKSDLKKNFKKNIKSIDGKGLFRINNILLNYINEK